MKIENWEIKERKYRKETMFDVFENEASDIYGKEIVKYHHGSFCSKEEAIEYVNDHLSKKNKEINVKNWKIEKKGNGSNENETVYEIYEELVSNENEILIKYFHTTLTKLSDALQYIAERI